MAYTKLDSEECFLKKAEKYFVVTDSCIGCAVCTQVCPRGNYSLETGGVKAQGEIPQRAPLAHGHQAGE